MEEKDYWLGFSVFPGIGSVTFRKLIDRFGDAKTAWNAPEKELSTIERLGTKMINDFLLFREKFDFSDYKKRLEKAKVTAITLEDDVYPQTVKQIKNAPFVLYAKGNTVILEGVKRPIESIKKDPIASLQDENQKNSRQGKAIAIVGTRKITQYGRQVTEMFTQELVSYGCIVVSGLAMGVDAVAHSTTIKNGGKTIAVLGCGVDCCYPRENQKIYDDIIDSGGLILSEIPLGQSAGVGTFPARNRIVAGISDGILVTEGAEDSGALITAEFGINNGKKVFAVPGPITSSLSKGPYKLIEKGTLLVTDTKQILEVLGIDKSTTGTKSLPAGKAGIKGDTEEEQVIIDLLEKEPMSFDEIVRILKQQPSEVAAFLSIMEVKGVITAGTNNTFSLAV